VLLESSHVVGKPCGCCRCSFSISITRRRRSI